MNQRLVWNFEFSPAEPRSFPTFTHATADELKWEARFFWPEDQIITLHNIDLMLLNLANYERKFKDDVYYLLPDNNFNIKQRHDDLQYKPLVKQTQTAVGFGPKIILNTSTNQDNKQDADNALALKLMQQIKHGVTKLHVTKEAFIYKFTTTPKIKLELSRIEVQKHIFFCACVEGKSFDLVEKISKSLLGSLASSDYITFLKKIIKS